MPHTISKIQREVTKKLEGFSPTFPSFSDLPKLESYRPEAKHFPVPELVLYTLREIMGWQWSGNGEKIRWAVYGTVQGEPIILSLKKFGFYIERMKDGQVSDDRLRGQLISAIKLVEKYLEPFAESQVQKGKVVIANHFHEFNSRYLFHRELAKKSFAKKYRKRSNSSIENNKNTQEISYDISQRMNFHLKNKREGFFHTTAMIDSYFSALEHRLILLRGFIGTSLHSGGLIKILQAKWDEKIKAVLPIPGDKIAEITLGKMRSIKERIRNPLAHGGTENDKGSLFFELPGIGTIPSNFTRFGDSIRFSFHPIEIEDYNETCEIFDRMDELLSSGNLANPHRFIVAGVDPAFDDKSMKNYAKANKNGVKSVEKMIDIWSHQWEKNINMDY